MANKPRWEPWESATPASFGTPEAATVAAQGSGPAWLTGQGSGPAWLTGQQAPPEDRAVPWAVLTGQNMAGPFNAFDTEFWEEAARQDEEHMTSGRGMRERWERPDATGVVLYNDPERGLKFGDVLLRGRKDGNIREGYAGLSEEEATDLLARISGVSREAWAMAYEAEAGRPGTLVKSLADEVEKIEKRNTEEFAKGLAAEEFESTVQTRAQALEESGVAKAATVAAGVGGGALAGSGIAGAITLATGGLGAPVGALIIAGGALVGGVGAWLNRDEQFAQVAAAMEQYEQAKTQGATAVGTADAISGWVGAIGNTLNPVRNFARGLYDAAGEGGVGDGVSRYNEDGGPLWFNVLDTAALVVDGIGSFGSRTAVRVYTYTMGATASAGLGGVVASAASGNVGFNPYSGQYEDLGWRGTSLRGASVGIDFAQTAMGRGVGQMLSARARGQAGTVQGGFRIGTDASGVRATQGLSFSMLIPSEAATGISARALARHELQREGKALTRENLARATAKHIDLLTSGRRSIATMSVNAVGEGSEEFVQAVLDAASVGEVPTFRQLLDAYRQGAATGAGAGLAVHRSSLSRSKQWRAVSDWRRHRRGEELLTDEQWNSLSTEQQAMEGTVDTERDAELLLLTAGEIYRTGQNLLAANVPEYLRLQQMIERRVEQELQASQPSVEPGYMSTMLNHDWGPQDTAVSLTAAIRALEARTAALGAVAEGREIRRDSSGELVEVTGDQRTYAERVLRTDLQLLDLMRQTQARIDAAGGSVAATRREIHALNRTLREWWGAAEGGEDADAYGKRRSASVLAGRYPLNATGSFQVLRLQISPQLQLEGAHNTALMPAGVQPMMGGDFDGDQVFHFLRAMLPDDQYAALRRGGGQLSGEAAVIKPSVYVRNGQTVLFDALARDVGTPEHTIAREAQRNMRSRLYAILGRSSMAMKDVRQVVSDFVAKASARDIEAAYEELFTVLPTRFAGPMRDLAEELDASPWLLLARAVEDTLSEMATSLALVEGGRHTTSTGATELPAVSKNMPRYSPRPARASSEMLSGAIISGNWDMFRQQGLFKYNAYREKVTFTEEDADNALHAFIERFALLNDGIARAGDEWAGEALAAQQRTLDFLMEEARKYHTDFGSLTVEEALVLVAGARVPDLDTVRRAPRSQDHVNVTQMALREVLIGLRRHYGPLILRDEALARRIAKLERLTEPNREDGTKTVAKGGAAFVEVLGAMRVPDLLGEAAPHLQSYTVLGLKNKLRSLRRDARREFEAALKRHPQYDQEVEGGGAKMTPYRVLIDNVIEAARMELHETAEGRAAGELARPNAQASRDFALVHDGLPKIAAGMGRKFSTAADVRALFEERMDLAESLLALLEDKGLAAAATVRDSEDGTYREIHFPQWIYDVFAESNTERAEMELLRNHVVFLKAALTDPRSEIDVDKVDDTIVALWMDLDYRANDPNNPNLLIDRQARDDFLQILFESQSVAAFESRVNQDFRFRREHSAPIMAWVRSRALLDADRFSSGVSEVEATQETRERLRDAAATVARELQRQGDTAQYLRDNADLINRLRRSRDLGEAPELWQRFKNWFDQVHQLPHLIAMSVYIEQAAHINEIVGGMGVKGAAPENVEALGRAIAAQLPTFDSAMGRLLASVTSGSISAVLTDMTQLARGARTFVMNDGTVVDWEGLTAERALDLLADERYAGTAARMIGLTAWDLNSETGISSLTSALEEGVAGFAMNPREKLFDSSQDAKFRRLMMIDGKLAATNPGAPPLLAVWLAQQMNWRETAVDHVILPDSEERQRMAVSILEDIADALQLLTSMEGMYVDVPGGGAKELVPIAEELTGEPTTLLNQVLLRAGRRVRRESNTLFGRLMPPEDDPTFPVMESIVQGYMARMAVSAKQADNRLLLALLEDMRRDYDRLGEYISPVELLVDHFRNFDDPAVQRELVALFKSWGEASQVVSWARDPILRVTNPATPRRRTTITTRSDDGEVATEVDIPEMRLEEWHTLARAAIAFTMHHRYGIATTSEVQIAEFPSLTNQNELDAHLSNWDPSGVMAVMDMFAPGVMRNPSAAPSPATVAQIELLREMDPQHPTVDPQRAEDAVYRLMAPAITDPATGQRRGVIGQWHALLPSLIHAGVGAVMASPAGMAIAMTGKNPGRLRMFTPATRRDWTQRPPDEELSTVELPVSQLVTTVEQGGLLDEDVTISLAQRLSESGVTHTDLRVPMVQLDGRLARSVQLIGPDGSARSLLNHPRFGPGMRLPLTAETDPGDGALLSLQTVSDAVSTLLREENVPPSQWDDYRLAVSFFHPRTKATSAIRGEGDDYNHSPWFDGVSGRTDAAVTAPSLVGFLYFGLDGVTQRSYDTALDALKKLLSALEQVTTMPEQRRRELMQTGLTDIAEMLDELTRFVMQQKIDGKQLPVSNYNAVRKFLELLYVVRYVDAEGTPRVLSVDQVIARQARGEVFEDGSLAEVVGLPVEHVLTLMGERDLASRVQVVDGFWEYVIDPSRVPPYLRFPAEAWTDGMFGGLIKLEQDADGAVRWATMNLLDHPRLQNQALPRMSSRKWPTLPGGVADSAWLPYRTLQRERGAERARDPQAGTRWAEQRERTRTAFGGMVHEGNVQSRMLHALEMTLNGDVADAQRLRAGNISSEVATHDVTTGWLYAHFGEYLGTELNGVLTHLDEVAQHVMLGDTVHVLASMFTREVGEPLEETFAQARTALDNLMATGATIHLPLQPGQGPLVKLMRQHLRDNGYKPRAEAPDEFVPRVTERRSQAETAYHSQLTTPIRRTSNNRVPVVYSDLIRDEENAVFSVNGGIGAMQSYIVRDVVQTARYAGYAPPATPAQTRLVIKRLLPLLRSEEGVQYLRDASQVKTAEERRSLDEAIENLIERMEQALADPTRDLLPRNNDTFGTSDFVPLVSYNLAGELVGIHLYRHGHEPANAEAIRGAVTAENRRLDIGGVRLTVDRAQIDPKHSSHRGEHVSSTWLGVHGFIVRMRVAMSDLGSKVFELFSGMKLTTAPPPSDFKVPAQAIFAGEAVRGVADRTSPASKNADQWWLNRPDTIIEAVGFDTLPYLVRAIYRVEPDDPEYAAHRIKVLEKLRAFAREHGGTVDPAQAVKREAHSFQEALGAHLQESLRELLDQSDLDLAWDDDPRRYADLTMLRLVGTALLAGADLQDVLYSPGFVDVGPGTESSSMHPVFTTLLSQLPADHPAYVAYVEQINSRMRQFTHSERGEGYLLAPSGREWLQTTLDDNGDLRTIPVMLAFPEIRVTDHNDALAEQVIARQGKGNLSTTNLAMEHTTWGAEALIDETKLKSSTLFQDVPALHGAQATVAQQTFNMGLGASPFGTRVDEDLPLSEVARERIENEALPARRALAVEIDDSKWFEGMPKAKAEAERRKFRQTFNRVRELAHLSSSQSIYLVEMIRAATVRPASFDRSEGEFLTYKEAMAALRLIENNLRANDWPLRRAAINVISRDALWAMRQGGYQLKRGDGKDQLVQSWEGWVEVALAELFTKDPETRRYAATSAIIDGLMHEYRKDVRGLGDSINPEVAAILRQAQLEDGTIIANPRVRNRLSRPGVQDGRMVHDPWDYESTGAMGDVLPQEARAMVEKRMASWEAKQGMRRRRRQSPRAEAKRGAQIKSDMADTNVVLRLMQTAYVGKAMLSLGVHISSYFELMQRSGQEAVVSFLSGQGLGAQGFTQDQKQLWRDTAEELVQNAAFYKAVYENTSWNPSGEPFTKFEEWLQRHTNFLVAAINDPFWGRNPVVVARAFMEAAWDTIQKSDRHVSVEQFLETLRVDPEGLAEINPDALRHGFARINYRKNVQDNLLEQQRRRLVKKVMDSRLPGANALGFLFLQLPTTFFRFRSNTLINMVGAQAPLATIAALLTGRSKRPGGLLDRVRGLDKDMDPEVSDQAMTEDSVDLTRAILRTGVSHTQLFLLGGLLSAMGFGGEDDEERFLEKLRRYQQTPVARDPLALEEDFRNAEAWFMDFLPAGMGAPSWVMRMFVSPAMGVARFFDTGDFRQIYWGIYDALGSMPLLNLDSVANSWKIAAELQEAAEAEAMEDNIEANARAMRLAVTAVGVLENMLFESATLSMLYQAADELDRDPYAIPLQEGGRIVRDLRYNAPLPSDALQDIQDEDSERFGQKSYVKRPDADAVIRGLAENRPMLAWAMSLIKRDSTYLRTNMVPKMRTAKAEELSIDEAEALVMSIFNNETGQEELTIDGAEAVVRGIHLGTVRADSPALQGVFIPREMRVKIGERMLADMVEKYLDLGFPSGKAMSLAKEEFYGQAYGEAEGLGVADILWNTDIIPQHQTQKYVQLNTTYVMGPGGRPIATGIKRSMLSALGIPMFDTYHDGTTSNMPIDPLLNSVDAVRGVNLGQRALVKFDESWEPPSAEDLAKQVEKALRDIESKLDANLDPTGRTPFGPAWRNFSRGRYSSGGGGYTGVGYPARYGGQALRFNAPRRVRSPRADDLYSINTSNPIIRRAQIRRERFASQRGRLNQWQ